jgi:mannose-6-phosphate isomerase-like protein (cupin superfamily)
MSFPKTRIPGSPCRGLPQGSKINTLLGVLQGEFHWHRHEQQDEFFLVLEGRMQIELEGREAVELGPRQAFIVPKGLQHRPVVPERTVVLMLERAGVVATGD